MNEREKQLTDALAELLAAVKLMCESLPIYSESSAAYTRKQRLDQAIWQAENAVWMNS